MLCSGPRWETARALPPASAVEGLAGRKDHGLTLLTDDVYYVKPMYPPGGHGRGSLLAPGVFTPGTKPDRGLNKTRTRTVPAAAILVLALLSDFWGVDPE